MERIKYTHKQELEMAILMQIASGETSFNGILRVLRQQMNKEYMPSRELSYHLYSSQNKKTSLCARKIVKRVVDSRASPPRVEYHIQDYKYFLRLIADKLDHICDSYNQIHVFLDKIDEISSSPNLGLGYELYLPKLHRGRNVKNITRGRAKCVAALKLPKDRVSAIEKETVKKHGFIEY